MLHIQRANAAGLPAPVSDEAHITCGDAGFRDNVSKSSNAIRKCHSPQVAGGAI